MTVPPITDAPAKPHDDTPGSAIDAALAANREQARAANVLRPALDTPQPNALQRLARGG